MSAVTKSASSFRLIRIIGSLCVVTALIAGSFFAFGHIAHAAPSSNSLSNYHVATYNMQGAENSSGASKWTSDIIPLTQSFNILALQEAGPVPPLSASGIFQYRNLTEKTVHFSTGITLTYKVYHYFRNFGTSTRPINREIYFMVTDSSSTIPTRTTTSGGRVNLAMVTTKVPDEVIIVPPAFAPTSSIGASIGRGGSRPTFGLKFGNSVYYTIHALASGGNDARGLLTNIDNETYTTRSLQYAALGDFNRDPISLRSNLPPHGIIYHTGRSTHDNGGELDYMVSSFNATNTAWPRYAATRWAKLSSDHLPVWFFLWTIDLAKLQTVSLSSFTNYFTRPDSDIGGKLTEAGERALTAILYPSGLTDVTVSNTTGSVWQQFNVLSYNGSTIAFALQNAATLQCLTAASTIISLEPCNGSVDEEWLFLGVENNVNEVLLYNPARQKVLAPAQDTNNTIALLDPEDLNNPHYYWTVRR